tara:strand:- start:33 stop:1016 length:984 start_codon:yes stop_codon:yes gene_type:complete
MRIDNKNIVLDDLDRKIIHQLDINSRQSTAEISKKVSSNKDTVNYRINKLLENSVIKRFSVAINTSKFGYQNIKVYFQFQNFSKEVEKEFFDYLQSIPRIGWVVRASGRWDALFCYWAKSSFEFYSVFIKILNKFSKYIYHKEIVHNINWFYYNRKWIDRKDSKIYPILYGEKPGNEKLDDLDTTILERLIDNAKIPIKDIAFETNQSAQTVINRIKGLKNRGIITKFGIDLNYEKLGLLFCKTFVYLDNITKKRLDELYDYCAKQPNIFALTTTLGAWDLELEIEVYRFEEVISIMDDLRDKFKDIIRSYESVIITKQSEVIYIGK